MVAAEDEARVDDLIEELAAEPGCRRRFASTADGTKAVPDRAG